VVWALMNCCEVDQRFGVDVKSALKCEFVCVLRAKWDVSLMEKVRLLGESLYCLLICLLRG